MDNVIWVVMAAAVAISLGAIVLYVGADGLEGVVEDGDETGNEAVCGFQQTEVDEGRAECGVDIVEDDQCYDQVCG